MPSATLPIPSKSEGEYIVWLVLREDEGEVVLIGKVMEFVASKLSLSAILLVAEYQVDPFVKV